MDGFRIHYRRNTSWQGTTQWLDGRKSVKFRSVLELTNLIHDAKLQAAGKKDNSSLLKNEWTDKDIVSYECYFFRKPAFENS